MFDFLLPFIDAVGAAFNATHNILSVMKEARVDSDIVFKVVHAGTGKGKMLTLSLVVTEKSNKEQIAVSNGNKPTAG